VKRPSPALLVELGRVARLLIVVERDRSNLGPCPAAARARTRGGGTRARPKSERDVLRRAISILDARMRGGPNCLRRALLEMSLDRGAAGEALHLQVSANGEPGSGHARLESWPEDGRTFDATFVI